LTGEFAQQMENDLVTDLRFKQNYLLVINDIYTDWPSALFIRRDFWEKLPNAAEVKVTPVLETALYQ
jgi:hypothetical protein